MSITCWPLTERPREKLLRHGAYYLSDAELLAILIQTGIPGKTALDLACELLTESSGLKNLLQSSHHEICQKRGLGKAKYALLKAAVELGRRYLNSDIQVGKALNDSHLTKQFLANHLKHYDHEVFACVFLDNHHRLIHFEELFHGTLTEANIYPREVVKRGLAHQAAKIILAHNHPSGNPAASQADKDMTLLLKQALALVDIVIIDHIIVGSEGIVSLAEMGMI